MMDPVRSVPLGLAAQGRAAVPAGVVETLQNAVVVPHQENFLVAQLEGAERPGTGHIAGAAYVHPIPIPDPLQLAFILTRIVIGVGGQARRVLGQAVIAQVVDVGCT